PRLIAPENGASGVSTHPLLSWDIVKGAKTYSVQVAMDKEFKKDIVVDTSNVRVTSLEVKKALKSKETYYWRVSAADSNKTSEWSKRWFETGSGKLSAPALSFPSNEAKGVSVNPTLSWKTSVGAVSYGVQLSTDENFRKDIIERDSIRVTSLEVKGLERNKKYYWRVNASDSTSTSDWSNERSFTTGSSRLAAPGLVAPSNSAVGVSISPTFTWTDVKEALQYNLQYSTEKDFKKDFVEVNGLKGTSYRVSLLSTKEKYYWRVQSKDSTAVSDWSDVWSFNTGASILATPELVSPKDGDEVSTSVTLKWNSSSGGKELFAVQVSTKDDFSNLLINEEKFEKTDFALSNLTPKKKYYWRVRALSDKETSEWSSEWKFETKVTTTTSVEQRESGVPSAFKLSQNFPNPFNPSTTIEFSIPKSGSVKIAIYNILGSLVATLVDQHLSAGTYRTQWNASGVASGVYFYQIQANGFIETKRLMFIK
ncbi:MAG: T9SS type A sorting domain-containing protein, partial [Ignavibacteriales bacterium]|nr:T9SS type A sorting domain-containing protein [Ignavibacteriales bacterium]